MTSEKENQLANFNLLKSQQFLNETIDRIHAGTQCISYSL